MMRTLIPTAVLFLVASTAHAESWIADDRPVDAPTLAIEHLPPAPEPPPLFGNRWTMAPAIGGLWLQINGHLGSGMAMQPTVTRTFDRFELQADYVISDWNDDTRMTSATVHRLGASVHYQAARLRVDRDKATLDFITQAGVGYQHVVRDHRDSIDRADLALGLGFRMLTDLDDRDTKRALYGLEVAVKLLVTPRPDVGTDLGCVLVFGVVLGK